MLAAKRKGPFKPLTAASKAEKEQKVFLRERPAELVRTEAAPLDRRRQYEKYKLIDYI